MSLLYLPINTAFTAGNAPTAATAYQLGTALTGHDSTARLVDGETYTIVARQVDGNGNPGAAYEYSDAVYTAGSPGTLSRGTVYGSSNSDAAVDWSGAGVGATPVIRIISVPSNTGRRLHSAGSLTSHGSGNLDIGEGASRAFLDGFNYEIDIENATVDTNSGFIRLQWYESGVGLDTSGTDHHESLDGAAGASTITDANTGATSHGFHPDNTNLNNAEAFSLNCKLYNPMAGGIVRATSYFWFRFSGSRAHFRGVMTKGPGAFSASGVRISSTNASYTAGDWTCWAIPR